MSANVNARYDQWVQHSSMYTKGEREVRMLCIFGLTRAGVPGGFERSERNAHHLLRTRRRARNRVRRVSTREPKISSPLLQLGSGARGRPRMV